MKIMRVVQWRYKGVWETSAIFVEPREAEQYALDLQDDFPADDIRIVLLKVIVVED